MTTIRAQCPTCGDVILDAETLQIRICKETQESAYIFSCPMCEKAVSKATTREISDLLVASGVKRTEWNLPLELKEHKAGPSITLDDLLDFHILLENDSWIENFSN
jgi:endogenous inhibitor of DNA gyrase (YacG/DUF329 family)